MTTTFEVRLNNALVPIYPAGPLPRTTRTEFKEMLALRITLAVFAAFSGMASAQNCHPIRYMPLGDSITEIVCWRAYLWEKLQKSGYANVNFVGSSTAEREGGCGVLSRDKDCEGHSGFLANHIVAMNLLPGWLRKNPADIVTIHLGSNDIAHGYDAEAILDAFTRIVEQLRESNPKMKIIVRAQHRYNAHITNCRKVAQILPLFISTWENTVQELNAR
jgi:hypothetical protein